MFKKKPKPLKKSHPSQPTSVPTASKDADLERQFHDDHGSVIIGNRKDPPKF